MGVYLKVTYLMKLFVKFIELAILISASTFYFKKNVNFEETQVY